MGAQGRGGVDPGRACGLSSAVLPPSFRHRPARVGLVHAHPTQAVQGEFYRVPALGLSHTCLDFHSANFFSYSFFLSIFENV